MRDIILQRAPMFAMAGDEQREVMVPALSPATLVIDGLKAARIYEFQASSGVASLLRKERYRSG